MTIAPIAPPQSGPGVWKQTDLSDPRIWTMLLEREEVDELTEAAQRLRGATDSELGCITARDFPLPVLGPKLRGLGTQLTDGIGFALIRGFPVSAGKERLASAVFAGVGSHLGSFRSQNAAGDLLGHVRNVGADPDDPNVRIYQTNHRQTFHTDSCDVVALMCLETAAEGGDSLVVSAASIYNEMLDRAPDLARLLFESIATDRRGEVPEGSDPFFTIPVLSWFDQSLTVMYQRQYIDSGQRFEGAPELTAQLVEALDLFDSIAEDPAFHLRMRLQVGDMQFVHNHSLLHDRTGFTDKPGSPRHLLRLWLSVPDDRALPPIFGQRFDSTTVGDRGGIVAGAE